MTITVQSDNVGLRIDALISENSEYTRSFLQKLIEDGSVLVNDKTVSKSYKVCLGDIITVIEPEPEPLEVKPENIPLDIVYEDDDLIVINKSKGMVVHPAAGNYDGTLVNALLYHCKDSLSGIGGVMRPGIVHRIDKLTSGLLVVAKNDFAHVALSEQIKSHDVSRVYHAIALGNIKENLTLDYPIGRSTNDRK
ncbi:MAG: RluA family pseudouridine synthase, partial [Clostridia bacterium]|nr:RluA family pseudouridine synthase [Clostridia bacterium]